MAFDLGYVNVDDLLAAISYRQLREWRAFYELERLGGTVHERADLRNAISAATIANHLREKKPLKLTDLMPEFPKTSAERAADGPPPDNRAKMLAFIARGKRAGKGRT